MIWIGSIFFSEIECWINERRRKMTDQEEIFNLGKIDFDDNKKFVIFFGTVLFQIVDCF